jgi:hypothetical protein
MIAYRYVGSATDLIKSLVVALWDKLIYRKRETESEREERDKSDRIIAYDTLDQTSE